MISSAFSQGISFSEIVDVVKLGLEGNFTRARMRMEDRVRTMVLKVGDKVIRVRMRRQGRVRAMAPRLVLGLGVGDKVTRAIGRQGQNEGTG